MKRLLVAAVVLLVMTVFVFPNLAQDFEPAEIVNDEGGTVVINGTMTISSQNVIDFVSEPLVILEDNAGFVDRNLDYVLPPESQVFGVWTSPFEVGEITYTLNLPIEPRGGFRDVDNDGEEDTGIQVFAVGFWNNRYGETYLEEYDGTGWSTGLASTRASINPETNYEINGGYYVVWAPDDEQGFPSGFGEDGLLFTEDDPIVGLPAGYTVVNMDTDPFTFDRSNEVDLELYEPDSIVPNDFSDESYADAFNSLVDVAIDEYAFTDLKGMDWEALRAEFLPRFEEADKNEDNAAYLFALRDFAWSIPDGHVAVYGPTVPLDNEFVENTDGGLGMAAVETDDGRFLVAFLLDGGPADEAGIEQLAEIIEVNGKPTDEAMADVVPYSLPFSTQEFERVQTLRYLLAGPVGVDFEITYQNPGDSEPTTVTLTTVAERDSFGFSSINRGRDFDAPIISYEFLDGGIGYIEVTDFSRNEPVLIGTWEEFMAHANAIGSPAIIIDLRYNGGGFSDFASRMASYLFHEEIPIYYAEEYNPEIDDFYRDENFPTELKPPLDESLIYDGDVVVLIGQSCASACEFFAYQLGTNDRATFVGQYATQGIAGGWPLLFMPDDIIFAMPTSRDVDLDGNIIIEGVGIQPDIKVPIDEESIQHPDDDLILDAAINYIDESNQVDTVDGGTMEIGDTVEGELEPGTRVRYTLEVPEDMTLDFLLTDETGELDTVLYIYVEGNEDPALQNDDLDNSTVNSGFEGVDVPGGLTLILEAAGFNDAESGPFQLTVQEFVPPEVTTEDAGEIGLGDTISGELEEGVRFQYTYVAEADGVIDITVTDETGELDTYLRVYDEGSEEVLYENDDIDPGVVINSSLESIEVTEGQTLVIEVAGFNDVSVGPYEISVSESGE